MNGWTTKGAMRLAQFAHAEAMACLRAATHHARVGDEAARVRTIEQAATNARMWATQIERGVALPPAVTPK